MFGALHLSLVETTIERHEIVKRPSQKAKKWHRNRQRRAIRASLAYRYFYRQHCRELVATKGWMYRSEAAAAAGRKMQSVLSTPSALNPPKTFCLEKNYDEVVEFIQLIKDTSRGRLNKKRRRARIPITLGKNYTHIDFVGIEEISTSAALLFASELDRVRRLSNLQFFTVDYDKWSPQVRMKLTEIGFLELLEIDQTEIQRILSEEDRSDVKVLKFSSGINVDRQRTRSIPNLIDQLHQHVKGLDEDARLILADGLKEAMTNVAQHAYPRDHNYHYLPTFGRWWMTGACDTKNGVIKVVFCDHGITIPVSVPRSGIHEAVRERVYKTLGHVAWHLVDDAQIVEAATKGGRSQTKESHRGLGLPQLCDIVDHALDGSYLRILSRKGEFIYKRGGETAVKNHLCSIGGTLIEWELKYLV